LPTNVTGIIDEVQHPAFATAIGLIGYGAKNVAPRSSSFKFALPKGAGGGSSKIMKKIVNIIKSFIP